MLVRASNRTSRARQLVIHLRGVPDLPVAAGEAQHRPPAGVVAQTSHSKGT